MKYEKGSIIDKWISEFPVRYVLWSMVIWLAIIAGLIYLGVQ